MRHHPKAAAILFALASAAHAQVTHIPGFVFNGDPGDVFGISVSGAGDVNGDGFDDFIVGAPLDDNNGTNSGSARVFSGFNGSVLYAFSGDSANDRFGGSVSGAGDVNDDGVSDFIVGAWLDDNNGTDSGSARVFSGADGAILYTFNGDSVGDQFGIAVSGAGDVNNDGFDDLIVGARSDDNNGTDSGSARVFSGADGSILYTFNGDAANDSFGSSVSGAGDVNSDGFDDLIVGARFNNAIDLGSGRARVFSGVNGSVLYTFDGDSDADYFGYSVSGAGDVNNDGFDDVIIGAPGDDRDAFDSGSARVISGLDGSVLYTFSGDSESDGFGHSVRGAGDVNDDGVPDLIVGAIWDSVKVGGLRAGSAKVFSGLDGSLLYTFFGDSVSGQFGTSVSGAGDVNNDGVPDLIVGAPFDDSTGLNSGRARVFVSRLNYTPCPGDTNDDDRVDFTDLNAVLAAFGQSGPALAEDVNRDGIVNFGDLNGVLSNFGNTCTK
jgi:hypothetical protein